MAIFITMESSEDADRYLLAIMISASLLGLLFLFGQKYFSFVNFSDYARETGRLTMQLSIPYLGKLTINPASAGDKFGFMFVLAYAFWLFHRSLQIRTVAAIMCIIFGAAIMSAQGRAGTLAALTSLVIITIGTFRIKKSRANTLLKFGAVAIFILGGTWYLAINSANQSFTQRILVLFSNPTEDTNFAGRLAVWRNGLDVFMQNPLGIGIFGYPDAGETWNVHNIWLYQLLSFGPLGIVGFVWILFVLMRAFLQGFRSINDNVQKLSLVGISLIIYIIVAGQFSPLIWEPYTVILVWAPLATIYALATLEQQKLFSSEESLYSSV
jgi:O-antigen ligase